jgi:nicotinamidase-related amidase
MPVISRENSALLVVDFRSRLMPAIEDGVSVVANTRRLLDAATMFQIPVLFTEQNAAGLGGTVPELGATPSSIAQKMTFDACRAAGVLEALPERRDIIVSGCEAHVRVLQSVMGLLRPDRRVVLVRDAPGSRRSDSKETAIRRMERDGADVVTTEMAVFERLGTAEDTRLRTYFPS